MTSWINQMASYIRSIDGNHMARASPCAPVSDADENSAEYSSAGECIGCMAVMFATKTWRKPLR